MTDQIEALSRRLVACPHWRWLRGMVAIYPDRRAEDVRAVVVKDASDCLNGEQMVCVETGITSFKWDPVDGWLPDLRDPATLGGLLTLVRMAYGDQFMTTSYAPGGTVPGWRTWTARGFYVTIGHECEAGALVAALEEAPAHAANSSVTTTGNPTS